MILQSNSFSENNKTYNINDLQWLRLTVMGQRQSHSTKNVVHAAVYSHSWPKSSTHSQTQFQSIWKYYKLFFKDLLNKEDTFWMSHWQTSAFWLKYHFTFPVWKIDIDLCIVGLVRFPGLNLDFSFSLCLRLFFRLCLLGLLRLLRLIISIAALGLSDLGEKEPWQKKSWAKVETLKGQ